MIRLIWQELKFRRNAIIGWALGLSFFPIVYVGIYPSVAEEMVGLADLEIYQAMGVNLGTFEDWIASILLMFVPLLLAIYALINGTGTLAGEEEDGRLEMLVTLPLPRWHIVIAKAIALSLATFIILLFVSLVGVVVFLAIGSQIETTMTAVDMVTSMLATWPLVFSVAMIGIFLASFSASRRAAALIATAVVVVGYFGSNLANSATLLEPFEPLFLFTYLDSTARAAQEGQPIGDVLVLLGVGMAALLLALLFFQRRNLTVGTWPWQRASAEVQPQ